MIANLPLPYDPIFAMAQQGQLPRVSEVRYLDDIWDRIEDPIIGRPMYFDKQGTPITLRQWGELREIGLDPDGHYGKTSYVRIAEDDVGEAHLSTVWLGMDHGWYRGQSDYRPLIFESMVFGGKYDERQMRYATEWEAIKGHAEALTDLQVGMEPWWSYGGAEDDEWHHTP